MVRVRSRIPNHTSINSEINLLSCSIDICAEPNGIVLGATVFFFGPAESS